MRSSAPRSRCGLVNRTGRPPCEYVPTASKKLNGFTLTVYWSGGKEALAVTKAGTRIAKAAMKGQADRIQCGSWRWSRSTTSAMRRTSTQ